MQVGWGPKIPLPPKLTALADNQSERYLHIAPRRHVGIPLPLAHNFQSDENDSYFVTELLGTDLHRLLTSRPLEKQFIQYFLYQILVRGGNMSDCTAN